MQALVVSDMRADAAHPERGRFVRDQVAALTHLEGVEVELYEFPPGAPALARAAIALRGRRPAGGGSRYDVVHAHFGLTAWPALAVPTRIRALTVHGTDVAHPRTRLITAAALRFIDLPAAVSAPLAAELPGGARRPPAVLPCGVDVERFRPFDRAQAREDLGLLADGRYLLFAADPARPEKRYDRALAVARAAGCELLALGGVDPGRVPDFVNAADAVLVPSEREGFGLAVLEALACDVAVLATPVGVHEEALAGIVGTLCAPFDAGEWAERARALADAQGARVQGRERSLEFSAERMAEHVRAAWLGALARSSDDAG